MSKQFTLNATERLKSRKAIQQIFQDGKSFSNPPFRIIYLEDMNKKFTLQAAFSVSKRHFKKAVDRNRIKRLMREAYRLQKKELQDHLLSKNRFLFIFFIYTGKDLPNYKTVYDNFQQSFSKVQKVME